MTNIYRIYTEDKSRTKVVKILDKHLEGYTLIEGVGAWKGERERSLIVEVIAKCDIDVRLAAKEIKRINAQEAVFVTRQEVELSVI